MQPATDSRRQKRLERITAVFSWQFFKDIGPEAPAQTDQEQFLSITELLSHLQKIDDIILHYAPKHGLDSFHKLDLAILRQALYELLYTDVPAAVVVNEAVEVSKEYGSEETPNFIHGVLGNYIDDRRKANHVNNSDTKQ